MDYKRPTNGATYCNGQLIQLWDLVVRRIYGQWKWAIVCSLSNYNVHLRTLQYFHNWEKSFRYDLGLLTREDLMVRTPIVSYFGRYPHDWCHAKNIIPVTIDHLPSDILNSYNKVLQILKEAGYDKIP